MKSTPSLVVRQRTCLATALLSVFVAAPLVHAQDADKALKPVVVQGSRNSQLGEAETASGGVVTQKQLEARTVYRPG